MGNMLPLFQKKLKDPSKMIEISDDTFSNYTKKVEREVLMPPGKIASVSKLHQMAPVPG